MTPALPFEAILKGMEDPGVYPHRPEKVEVVHTHISAVFIAPPRVYKVKKPKNYGFLDFTTLEKRRYFCRREVLFNRRLAEKVYLGVGSLVEAHGKLHLVEEDRDDALEYCVIMEYLDPRGFLIQRLKEEPEEHLKELLEIACKKLAAFYRQYPLPHHLKEHAEPEVVFGNALENFLQMEPLFPPTLDPRTLAISRFFTEQFFRAFRGVFEYRKGRYLVEGHGDLHTWHLHYSFTPQGVELSILDGIEFNERFRCLDLMADVAFLIMDLEAEGYGALARFFAEAFLRELPEDPSHRAILPFYLAYRAMVRAKVNLLTLQSPEVPDPVKAEAFHNLKRYLALALRYSLKGLDPLLLVFSGPSGSGKSFLAEGLCQLLGVERQASDRIRKALAGIAPLERSDSPVEGGIYTREMSERTYRTMAFQGLSHARKQGIGVLDATYLEPAFRKELEELAGKEGIPVLWVVLDEGLSFLKERVSRRKDSESEATLEVLEKQWQRWQIPIEPGYDVLYLPATTSLEFLGHALVYHHLRRIATSLSSESLFRSSPPAFE